MDFQQTLLFYCLCMMRTSAYRTKPGERQLPPWPYCDFEVSRLIWIVRHYTCTRLAQCYWRFYGSNICIHLRVFFAKKHPFRSECAIYHQHNRKLEGWNYRTAKKKLAASKKETNKCSSPVLWQMRGNC